MVRKKVLEKPVFERFNKTCIFDAPQITQTPLQIEQKEVKDYSNAVKIHLVLAKYCEDISWLADYTQSKDIDVELTVFVYNKGRDQVINNFGLSHEHFKVFSLPNVGRESDTYLTHYIQNYKVYQTISNCYVICSQADPRPHIPKGMSISQYMDTIIADAMKNKMSIMFAKPHNFREHTATYNFNISQWNSQQILKYGDVYGKWFEKYVRKDFPRPVVWWAGAIFCFNSELIKAKPIDYFTNIKTTVDNDINPETGHFCERSWYYILMP